MKSVNYDRDPGSVDTIKLAQMEIGLMSGDQPEVQKTLSARSQVRTCCGIETVDSHKSVSDFKKWHSSKVSFIGIL